MTYLLNMLQIKPRKKSESPTGFQLMTLRDTSVMLYQLSYDASLEAGQVQVQFIPII